MRERIRCLRHAMPVLLALALPGLATAAQPKPSPVTQSAYRPPAVQHVVDKRKGSKPKHPTDDKARQPYQELVDNVSESVDEFRDDNVSENRERDRLPEP